MKEFTKEAIMVKDILLLGNEALYLVSDEVEQDELASLKGVESMCDGTYGRFS